MLSRAWSYWNSSSAEQSSSKGNDSSSNVDLNKEKEREEMKNGDGTMSSSSYHSHGHHYSMTMTTTTTTTTTNMTTTTTTMTNIEHTSGSSGGGNNNNNNNNNKEGGVMVEEEKIRESRALTSSSSSSSSSSHHYTFNPIQYHYTKVCKSRTTMTVISHSTPMSLPLDQLLQQNTHNHHNRNRSSSSPRQVQAEKKAIMNSEKNMDGEDNNDDSSVMVGISAVSISNSGEHGIITRYFDSMPVTLDEREALFELHKWIGNDTLSNKMKEELCLGDMIMSYYSSFSRSNPDAKGCWKRWVSYLDDSPLKDVNFNRVKEFFATGLYNVAYDRENRPVFIINTKYYDDSFGPEITAKATILFITSLLWNIRTNEFDFNALRKGVCVYADLSHYSINMLAWNVIQACKSALVAFPFQLIDIYCVNTPTFVYMLRQIAAKIIVPHAMEKIKVLGSPDEYFEKYGIKSRTPVENGGTWKISTTQWMKERGFIESEDKN